MSSTDGARIARIEQGQLVGKRPRSAGANARRGVHGEFVRIPFTRVTTDEGATGVGLARLSGERAADLLGTYLADAYAEGGVADSCRDIEFPLWDLAGNRTGKPVYALAAEAVGAEPHRGPLTVRCYDTSLYFDDLHLDDNDEAAALIAEEARFGYYRGHRAFKIKVGRGCRYMPLEKGTARDIAVIRAVREAVGATSEIMIDANNGYNLSLTKRVLDETADCRLYWVEEPFHEDAELDGDLKGWLRTRELPIRIADGEGDASPKLLNWAREGLIDVVQYDIFGYGFSRWLALGQGLDANNVGSGPHHYGAFCGNYVTGHLAAAIEKFQFVEWDDATIPGLDARDYRIENGMLHIPDVPGFGWTLDDVEFKRAVTQGGFNVSR